MTPSYTRKTKTKTTRKNSSSRRPTSCLNKKHYVEPSISPVKPSNGGYFTPMLDEAESSTSADLCCMSSSLCSTPKAERFRIPEIGTCPPAPKKRRIRAVGSTRSLRRTMPLAFFASPDIELFFYYALRGIHV